MRKKSSIKFGPAALAIFYFLSTGPLAHALETNFWKDRHRNMELAQLSNGPALVPPPVSSAPSLPALPIKKTVIHIQDVHLNYEAQENIGKTVQDLMTQSSVGLVGLEGAFADIDLSGFRSFTNKEAVRIMADYLLKENKISGPIHAALVNPSGIPPFVGVDNAGLYKANVDAYRLSRPQKEPVQKRLELIRRDVENKILSLPNPRLVEFHSHVQSYREGKLPFIGYTQYLAGQTSGTSPYLNAFLEASEMESSLNYDRVDMERTRLLSELTTKLNRTEASQLSNAAMAYRTGDLGRADFYSALKKLCEKKNISLAHFKALDAYIQYVLLTASFNSETLRSEISLLEKTIYRSLAQSKREQALAESSKTIYLTGKLLDFSLTPDEWSEYEHINSGIRTQIPELKSFELFYANAALRNEAIASNLLAAMKKNKVSSAILVTGGFHSPGIDRLLNKAGMTVVSYVPKINPLLLGNGSSYLNFFDQRPTPLEKLFADINLFTAPPPVNTTYAHNVLRLTAQALSSKSGTAVVKTSLGTIKLFLSHHRDAIKSLAFVAVAAAAFWNWRTMLSSNPVFHTSLSLSFWIAAGLILWILKSIGLQRKKSNLSVGMVLVGLAASLVGAPSLTAAPSEGDLSSLTAGSTQQPVNFNDPQLDAFIKEALTNNPGIKVIKARLEAAQAQLRKTRWDFGPTGSSSLAAGSPVDQNFSGRQKKDFVATLALSQEIDLGRLRARERAAVNNARAQQALLVDGRQLLETQVKLLYFSLMAANAQYEIKAKIAGNAVDYLNQIKINESKGQVSRVQVDGADIQVRQAKSDLVGMESMRSQLASALEVAVGRAPGEKSPLPISNTLPNVSNSEVFAPLTNLNGRWDVRATELKAVASSNLTRAAQLDRLPRITLNADVEISKGTLANSIGVERNIVNGFVALVLDPLLYYGQRKAAADAAKANQKAAEAEVVQAQHQAWLEISDALAKVRQLREQEELASAASEDYSRLFESSLAKFKVGLFSRFEVLSAEQELLRAQSRLLETHEGLIKATVEFQRSLERKDGPAVTTPTKKQSWFSRFFWVGVLCATCFFPFVASAQTGQGIVQTLDPNIFLQDSNSSRLLTPSEAAQAKPLSQFTDEELLKWGGRPKDATRKWFIFDTIGPRGEKTWFSVGAGTIVVPFQYKGQTLLGHAELGPDALERLNAVAKAEMVFVNEEPETIAVRSASESQSAVAANDQLASQSMAFRSYWYLLLLVPIGLAIGARHLHSFWIWSTDRLKKGEATPASASREDGAEKISKDKTLGLSKQGRFEDKYLVPVGEIPAMMRELVETWGMIPDKHVHFKKDGKAIPYQEAEALRFVGVDILPYPIISNYFENRNPKNHRYMTTMMEREFQHPKRAKARLRWYPDLIAYLLKKLEQGKITPKEFREKAFTVHAEVKRRYGEGFRKLRVEILMMFAVVFAAGKFLFDYLPPNPSASNKEVFRNREAAQKFRWYVNQWKLEPYMWVSYERTPFHNAEGTLRVNFDENVRHLVHPRGLSLVDPVTGLPNFPKDEEMHLNYPGLAVFEIKYEGDPPAWVHEFVRIHNLVAVGTSKVVDAHNMLRNERFDQNPSIGPLFDPADKQKYALFGTEWAMEENFPFDEWFDRPEAGIFTPEQKEFEGEEPDDEGEEASYTGQESLFSFIPPAIVAGISSLPLLKILTVGMVMVGFMALSSTGMAAPGDFAPVASGPFSGIDWRGLYRSSMPLYHAISNAFISGMIFACAYKWTQEGPSYDRKFATAVALFPIVISTIVFTLINAPSAVFITVGIIGIAGMLNFRTILRATLDMMYIAAGVAAGVAIGTEYYVANWFFTGLFFLAVGFFHSVEFGVQNRVNLHINFKWNGPRSEIKRLEEDVLKQVCERTGIFHDNFGFVQLSMNKNETVGFDVSYRLRLIDPSQPQKAIQAIENYRIDGKPMVESLASQVAPPARGWMLTAIRFVLRTNGQKNGSNGNADESGKIERMKAPLDLRIHKNILRLSPVLLFLTLLTINIITMPHYRSLEKTVPAEIQSIQTQYASLQDGLVEEVINLPVDSRFVKKGTPLVKIRTMTPQQYTNQLEVLAAQLRVDQQQDLMRYQALWVSWQQQLVNLKMKEALYPNLKTNYDRLKALAATDTVSQADLDQADALEKSTRVEIEQLRVLTEKAKTDYEAVAPERVGATNNVSLLLAQTHALYDRFEYEVDAPFDGNVTIAPSIVPGSSVFKGTTPLWTMTSPALKEIETFLIPPFSRKPFPGELVEIYLRNFNQPKFYGKVIYVDTQMSLVNTRLQRGPLGGLLYPEQIAKTPSGLRIVVSAPAGLNSLEIPGDLVDVKFTGHTAVEINEQPATNKPAAVEIKPANQPAAPLNVAPAADTNRVGQLDGRPVRLDAAATRFNTAFTELSGAAVNVAKNRLYLVDDAKERIEVFDATTGLPMNDEIIDIRFLRQPGDTDKPDAEAIAVDSRNGKLVLALETQRRIHVIDPSNPTLGVETFTMDKNLTHVEGLAIHPDGRIFLANSPSTKSPAIHEVMLNRSEKRVDIIKNFDLSRANLGPIRDLAFIHVSGTDNKQFDLLLLESGQTHSIRQLAVDGPERGTLLQNKVIIPESLRKPEALTVLPEGRLFIGSETQNVGGTNKIILKFDPEQPHPARGAFFFAPFIFSPLIAFVKKFQTASWRWAISSTIRKGVIFLTVMDDSREQDLSRVADIKRIFSDPALAQYQNRLVVVDLTSKKDLPAGVAVAGPIADGNGQFHVDEILKLSEEALEGKESFSLISSHPERLLVPEWLKGRASILKQLLGLWTIEPQTGLGDRIMKDLQTLRFA